MADLFGHPFFIKLSLMLHDILLIITLFVLETILSVDNAAVLAVMVKDLPGKQSKRALQYGMAGALVFRGLSLFLVSYLLSYDLGWLKVIGGLYLLRLTYTHFTPKIDSPEEGIDKNKNRIYKFFLGKIGLFWSTVIMVEIMDMVFSIDNIFAAVAMTDKFWIIFAGVAAGIITMRFVAMRFVKLMDKYPALEKSAYIVIGLLGLKLVLTGVFDYFPDTAVARLLGNHYTDLAFSVITLSVFFMPLARKPKA